MRVTLADATRPKTPKTASSIMHNQRTGTVQDLRQTRGERSSARLGYLDVQSRVDFPTHTSPVRPPICPLIPPATTAVAKNRLKGPQNWAIVQSVLRPARAKELRKRSLVGSYRSNTRSGCTTRPKSALLVLRHGPPLRTPSDVCPCLRMISTFLW